MVREVTQNSIHLKGRLGSIVKKISILIHMLTHNMKHQKATRPLLCTSLMNQLILIALSQESLALSCLDNYDA